MAGVVAFPVKQRRISHNVANHPAGLAHDLRNVMASLELCAEVMAQPGVLTTGNEYLAGEVRSVADAAIGLLRQTGQWNADHAGLQARWMPTGEIRNGNAARLLKNMESLLRRTAGTGVRVDVECASCWGHLAMPPVDLTRVLVNLVRNASEAMPQGGRIRVAAQMSGGQSFVAGRQPSQSARAVIISVQDSGPGIPKELAERIFEPGFSTKHKLDRLAGSDCGGELPETERGLGLAVARDLVEISGGALVLVPGARGARFEMEIPLTNVMPSWASRMQFDVEGGRA